MKIAVYAFDGITMFHLAAPLIVIETAVDLGLAPGWTTVVWTKDGRSVNTSSGVSLHGIEGPAATVDADVVIFPSWPTDLSPPDEQLQAIVRRCHGRGAKLVGLCLGAFPVAASGVLDGRTAVTHWAATDALASLNPTVDVRPSALYIDHHDVLTCAGTASSIDACLHLLRSLLGSAAATTVARHLVVAPHRDGDQAQFIHHPVPNQPDPGEIGHTIEWALANLDQDLSVAALAAHACMSKRTFTRRFHECTGSTPAKWVLGRRLDAARVQLETTSWTVQNIAAQCGFASPVTFRQNFVSKFATTPSAYRRRFADLAPADRP